MAGEMKGGTFLSRDSRYRIKGSRLALNGDLYYTHKTHTTNSPPTEDALPATSQVFCTKTQHTPPHSPKGQTLGITMQRCA